jgi:resuscitation-promoting factor RpfB
MKRSGDWLKSLSVAKKVGLGIVALFVIAGVSGSHQQTNLNSSSTANKSTSTSTKAPTVTTKAETDTQAIPFTSTNVDDSTLAKGTTKVTTTGVNGSETLTYKITLTNGKQTDKKLVTTVVNTQPVTQVTSVGTYVAPAPAPKANCDPNYSGACVPNVYPSDVDCAGGSGNGPYYVQGPVTVIGTDVYHLDANGNGIGCE